MKPVKPRTSQSAQQPSCFGRDNEGAAKEGLSLHSQTVQAVSEEYCTRRRQFKKAKLRSGGFCEDARGRDTNAAKNLLARGWALMADLGFCQIAIAGEARAVEAAHTEHRTGQKQWGDSGCRNPLPSCFKQFLRGGCQCYNPPRQHHTQRRACHVGAHIKP